MLTTDANLGNLGGFVAFPNQWAPREAAEDPVFFTAPLSIGSDSAIAPGSKLPPLPPRNIPSHPVPSKKKSRLSLLPFLPLFNIYEVLVKSLGSVDTMAKPANVTGVDFEFVKTPVYPKPDFDKLEDCGVPTTRVSFCAAA